MHLARPSKKEMTTSQQLVKNSTLCQPLCMDLLIFHTLSCKLAQFGDCDWVFRRMGNS